MREETALWSKDGRQATLLCPDYYLESSLRSCSLPLTVSDFNWPSSSTSTRSCPFSTILQERRQTRSRPSRRARALTLQYRLVVIFLPLMNLVEVDTDRKLPIPPPPPPPLLLNDEDEKEVIPPPMSENAVKPAEEQQSEENLGVRGSWCSLSSLRTYPGRTLRNYRILETLRSQTGVPSCGDCLPSDGCGCR